jgi:hypothetical protein
VAHDFSESLTLMLQKRWQNKYIVGLGYVTPQKLDTCGRPDCVWDVASQYMIGAERLFTWRRLSAGIGLYYIHHHYRISSAYLNARLSLEYAVTDRMAIKFSHISNNQTGKEITLCNEAICITDEWNPGLDSLMFVWKF